MRESEGGLPDFGHQSSNLCLSMGADLIFHSSGSKNLRPQCDHTPIDVPPKDTLAALSGKSNTPAAEYMSSVLQSYFWPRLTAQTGQPQFV